MRVQAFCCQMFHAIFARAIKFDILWMVVVPGIHNYVLVAFLSKIAQTKNSMNILYSLLPYVLTNQTGGGKRLNQLNPRGLKWSMVSSYENITKLLLVLSTFLIVRLRGTYSEKLTLKFVNWTTRSGELRRQAGIQR